MNFKEYLEELEAKIQQTYERGVSLEEAERLAGEFLVAQIRISKELETQDLDARLRKSGLKAIRAAAYTDICAKSDKKPTETAIDAMITLDKVVQQEQKSMDAAEVSRDSLERYYHIMQNAHLHFRAISKGRFEG